jgi:hypothetical protein
VQHVEVVSPSKEREQHLLRSNAHRLGPRPHRNLDEGTSGEEAPIELVVLVVREENVTALAIDLSQGTEELAQMELRSPRRPRL